jgi:hypothetical protein
VVAAGRDQAGIQDLMELSGYGPFRPLGLPSRRFDASLRRWSGNAYSVTSPRSCFRFCGPVVPGSASGGMRGAVCRGGVFVVGGFVA